MSAAIPYIVAFFAVSAYALLGPIAKKVGLNLPPFSFIAASSFIIFACTAVVSFFLERGLVIAAFKDISWGWLVAFSLINLVGYVGYLWAIARIPIVQYEMFLILGPIIAGIFAVVLLNEPFHSRYILALLFMAAGLIIAIKPQL